MNVDDSSGANERLEREAAPQPALAPTRSAASALLSATSIWSAPQEPAAPAVAPPPPPKNPEAVSPETVSPETVPEALPETILEATPATASGPAETEAQQQSAPKRKLRPSELVAEARFFSSSAKRPPESDLAPRPLRPEAGAAAFAPAPKIAPNADIAQPTPRAHADFDEALSTAPRKLSLALQGGGSFGAFTWGVLERLLEEPACEFDAISGASVGAVNAALLACGLATGGREGARRQLARFWNRITEESSFRSLMLIGAFSPAGSSVAFASTLRSGQFDPFDLDPLREVLAKDIDFAALRASTCPKLLIAATRIRDGRLKIFGNADMTPDVLLASTCPPLVHCAIEIAGEPYWDGGFAANPPLLDLVRGSETSDVLLVQITPSRDSYVPITMAAIDRRLDQITANAALNAEVAGLELYCATTSRQIVRIAAEDEIDGLAQRSTADLGRSFITLLHKSGRAAADRWLRPGRPAKAPEPAFAEPVAAVGRELQRRLEELSEA
jgi:NTE family protein